MAEKKPAKKSIQKSAKSAAPTAGASQLFTAEEKAAMRDYIKEKKAAAHGAGQESEESAVLAKAPFRWSFAAAPGNCHMDARSPFANPSRIFGVSVPSNTASSPIAGAIRFIRTHPSGTLVA